MEDWAFAHTKGLKDIIFPAKEILFGKKVFLGCDGLQRVFLTRGGEAVQGQYEGMSFFLASVFRLGMEHMRMDLSDLRLAGSADPEVKGFLLECELAEAAENDFFGNLEL